MEKEISLPNLPSGWNAGNYVSYESIYGAPPAIDDSSRIVFFGLRNGDQRHRVYDIPSNTPIADVVREFKVGAHGAASYGFDASCIISLVADKATKIHEIIPCHVIFADPAGLKLRFERQITEVDLSQIETLFSQEDMLKAGMERYLSEWKEGRPLLSPLLEENLIHLWWD